MNNVITGSASNGVFWMRDPRFLVLSAATSVATFYLWPVVEDRFATEHFNELLAAADVPPGSTSMTLRDFERALGKDGHKLEARLRAAIEAHLDPEIRAACDAAPSLRPSLYFE